MVSYGPFELQQSEGGESEYADDAEDEVPDVDELQSEDEDKVCGKRSILHTDVLCVV